MAEPRTFEQRKADALTQLEASSADAWVATASPDGRAHMVPLSIGWCAGRIVLVIESRSVTAKNLVASKMARLGMGGTRDVVMVVAELVGNHGLASSPPELVSAFASQSGWDPTDSPDAVAYRLLELRPLRIQAWREANELTGRTLMRNGDWGPAGAT